MGAARRLEALSLRARLTAAAVLALAVVGLVVLLLLRAAVAADGREAVDAQLRLRAEQVLRRPPPDPSGFGSHGGGGPGSQPGTPADRLLSGTGSFVQVAVGGQVVQQAGDVPSGAPAPPARDGFTTVTIAGQDWRSLTQQLDGAQLQLLQTLQPVDDRVAEVQRNVVVLGLLALLALGGSVYAFATLAIRPLERLRAGAARIHGADDLRAARLPDDDGPAEVRQLASALNGMLVRVERSTGALRRFAADAGHELRTPLTGLRANLDVLARNPDLDAAQRQELVAEMAAEQERVVGVLEGLTALARGDAADALPREDVDLGDVVDAAVHGARRRHADARFEVEDRAPGALVHGWPEGLRLVLDNLLENAAVHGGGRVGVRLRHDGDAVVLEVADDGPGVPVDERARVVEPFARGVDPRAPGTGLGLAIVAQQVALHGGTLALGDAIGGGLLVTVRLPVASDGVWVRDGASPPSPSPRPAPS